MLIKDMLQVFRYSILGVFAVFFCLRLEASAKLPQGIDACVKVAAVHSTAHRYTDLLRRFMPGEKLEDCFISYLSDLGYPDFPDLQDPAPLGFFLSSKEGASPLRLAFIAVRLGSEGSLRATLEKKGWLLYDYKGWTFMSLASVELFDNALLKDAWVDYLNEPTAEDLVASLSLSGLEEEIECLYHHGMHAMPFDEWHTGSYFKRPLFQAIKKEFASLEAIGLSCRYTETDDRLVVQQWLQAKTGSALEKFLSQDLSSEKPIDNLSSLGDPLSLGIRLQPSALKDYASHLQAICHSLANFESFFEEPKSPKLRLTGAAATPTKLEKMLGALPAYSQESLYQKRSTALDFLLHTLESFEKHWDGHSCMDLSFKQEDPKAEAMLPVLTVLSSGNFSQATLFAIGQDQASYIPSCLQSLRPNLNVAIQSKFSPEALKVGEHSFNTLAFQFAPINVLQPTHLEQSASELAKQSTDACFLSGFTLYSGLSEGYAIFSNTQDQLVKALEAIDQLILQQKDPSDLKPEAATDLGKDLEPTASTFLNQPQRMVRIDFDLLAYYPVRFASIPAAFQPKDGLFQGDLSLHDKIACLRFSLPLKGLEALFEQFKTGSNQKTLDPSSLYPSHGEDALAEQTLSSVSNSLIKTE